MADNLSQKYRMEILRVFDRLKLDSLPAFTSTDSVFKPDHPYFKQDGIFLLYVPDKKKAESFLHVYDKRELYWNLKGIRSKKLREQTVRLLCDILNMDIPQKGRRDFLEPLKKLVKFCDRQGIDDMEMIDASEEKRFALYLSCEKEILQSRAETIISYVRRVLFLTDQSTNWDANVWFLDRFRIGAERKNESTPVRKISFLFLENKELRKLYQEYVRYQIGLTDCAVRTLCSNITFQSDFLKFVENEGLTLDNLAASDIRDYARSLEEKNLKAKTYNAYILSLYSFLDFLMVKKKMCIGLEDPRRYLKKTYGYHKERSIPEDIIARIIKVLPQFPEELQVMYIILLTTGLRKSELCTLKGNAFYRSAGESWMRVYQPKMKREKVIPVPENLMELAEEYIRKHGIGPSDYIFQNTNGEAYNGCVFSSRMVEECNKHGITCGDYIFQAHDYRHEVATRFYGNGVSIQGIREYLGHASENMTKQYIDYMPERIAAKQEDYFASAKKLI